MEIGRVRFSTFVLVGGQRVRVTPPPNSNWDLILVNCISENRPFSIINEIQTNSKAPIIKNTLMTFDADSPSLIYTSMQVSKNQPFICYLSKKKGIVQFVFSSNNSNDKLEVEQINKESLCACSLTPNNSTNILNEIRRIAKSEQPLIVLTLYLAKLDQRAYFKSHICNFENAISDALDFFLGQIAPTIEKQACQLIKFIDFQMSIAGRELYIIEALILKKIVNQFPRLKLILNHMIINTNSCMAFIRLFLEIDQFDGSLFLHRIPYPNNVDVTTSFQILSYLVDSRLPFYAALLKLFTSYVPTPLLKLLLSSNKIYCDSNFSIGFLSQLKSNVNPSFRIDIKSKLVFQRNEIDIQVPNKNHSHIVIIPSAKIEIKNVDNISIDQRKEWSFSKIENKKSKIDNFVIIDRKGTPKKTDHLKLSRCNTFSYIARTKSSDLIDTYIIFVSALFAIVVLLFVWTHFSYYIE